MSMRLIGLPYSRISKVRSFHPLSPMRLRQLPVVTIAALVLLVTGRVDAQEPTPISLLKSAPQQFINREITVVGQVLNVEINSAPGLATGTFRVLDDSDPTGIQVRTSGSLPQTGKVYRVTGQMVQFAGNALDLGLTETARSAVRPSWLPWAIGGGSALALFLAVLLIRSLREDRGSNAGSSPGPSPIPPFVPPQPAPPMPMPVIPPQPVPLALPMIPPQPAPVPSPPQPRTEPFVPAPKHTTQPFIPTGAYVEVVEGEERPREVPVGTAEFQIGRSGGRSNHLTLANSTVSQAHATIKMDAATGKFFLLNESRTNKARVNGEPVEMAPLTDGSKIELGAVTLMFHQRNGRSA